ncbi:MAG: TonB-dependent receptor plug domain-containing protein, partial [Desulfobacteraceae bacterium]|nr:TonB-dependent receptor plug domain-containing protein [Desulfobacteraceae bacterium]
MQTDKEGSLNRPGFMQAAFGNESSSGLQDASSFLYQRSLSSSIQSDCSLIINNYCGEFIQMKEKQKGVVLIILSLIFVLSASNVFADTQINRLDDIVITGTKTPHTLQTVPVETIVITKEDIEKKNSQNVMDLLKDIPGIQTAFHNDVFGTYTWVAKMRGLDFNNGYALILVDGQRS